MKPKLRFPEFIDNWTLAPLSDFLQESRHKNTNKEFNKTQVLSVAAEAGVVNQMIYHGRSYAGKSIEPYGIVRRGELVYTKSPLKAYPYGIIKVNKNDDGVVSTLYAVYRHNSESSGIFLDYYFYLPERINKYLKPMVNIGAKNDMKINNSYVLSGGVVVPTITEQQKIADFLTAVDERIALQEKKIELLEQYKKGVMQQIFSQKIRFKDEDGKDFPEWGESKLGNIANITTGKLDANAMEANGRYRFYTCARGYYKINEYAFDTEALLISGNGANVGYIHYYKGKFNAYQRTYVLDSFNENIFYIKCYLDVFLRKRIMQEKFEGNMPYIVLSTLSEMKIPAPSKLEQVKIANLLSGVDGMIENEKDKNTKVLQFKKGLLQQMFV